MNSIRIRTIKPLQKFIEKEERLKEKRRGVGGGKEVKHGKQIFKKEEKNEGEKKFKKKRGRCVPM